MSRFLLGFTLEESFAIISKVGQAKLLRQDCFSRLILTGNGLPDRVPGAVGKIQTVYHALIKAN